ncbi:uncharacterized protein TRIADDRAFT_51672 [Trichoplax adhaerens]|uniref:G-protein coupled receptors family 1 profile domain-containing protein n=1 Tax=Trichoplax adhaerens TaxID=10228 RepID=B3RKG5_TRIAD|nr:hypothetical protein TRIADDRAFT_51672 [Trichoplax adhaerens]EDV28595.1 hypothetical protein TRIADDRAFT_51672 [Trichoplax adhaerens]|eukprot:XP_002107797.1 hypothetical protein TRIADDRAFT_51672 [Trichoplax adhaerens]
MPILSYKDIFVVTILGIIASVASFGNLFNLYLIYHSRSSQLVGTLLLANLGLADLFSGLVVMPLAIYSFIVQDTISPFLCQLWAVLASLSIGVSFYTTAAISIDRCIAVASPFYYSQSVNLRVLKVQIVILWLITSVIAIMPMLGLKAYGIGHYSYITGSQQCWVDFTDRDHNYYIGLVLLSILSCTIVIIVLCYSIIFIIAWRKGLQNLSGHGTIKKSIRTTGLIVGTSLMCWIPLITISYVEFIDFMLLISDDIVLAAYLLTFCSSAINPVVYSLTNSELKRRVRLTLRRTNVIAFSQSKRKGKVNPIGIDSVIGNLHSSVIVG